jgi:membrane fusion protein (multidrug efflux system)
MKAEMRNAVLLAVAALTTVTGACTEPVPAAPPPPEVYVAPVIQKDVPIYLELVGQTEGYQDVEIRARVEGFLQTMTFREGSFVRKGDLLYEIDRKPLEAVLAAARAERSRAEADLEKANNDVARYEPLVVKQAVSRQELDNARSAQAAARAQVEAAAAAVDKATLDLSYTRVFSPIDGLIGTTNVQPGSLVGRGESTLLTTISQINPIIFRVGITEADYLRLIKRAPEHVSRAQAEGVQLTLADGTLLPGRGQVRTAERAVNAATGTLAVEIVFPNPDSSVRPGQYGRARALIEMKAGALLVPQRAVQAMQNLYSVALVAGDNQVAFRNVKVGPRIDDLWVIEEGLKPGEQVVVEGLQGIQDGMTVRTKPMTPAANRADAAPAAVEAK